MADGSIRVPPDSTGKRVDAASLDVGADVVYRQRIAVASNTGTAAYAAVLSSGPAATDGGLVVRNIPSGVQDVSLGASTSNIGYINNISATVVTGLSYVIEKTTNSQVQVGDSANAALRVNVVAGAASGPSHTDGTPFTAQAAALVPIGGVFDDASSNTLSEDDAGIVRMTTNRAFHVNLRTDGGVAMDDSTNSALRVSIVADLSATAIIAGVVAMGPTNIMSASHGPRQVTVSTSANATLVASPGAGNFIYITQLACSNAGGTGCDVRIGTSASIASVVMFLAASGGGFVMNFDPPWKLSASEAALCSVNPNVSEVRVNVNFYVLDT